MGTRVEPEEVRVNRYHRVRTPGPRTRSERRTAERRAAEATARRAELAAQPPHVRRRRRLLRWSWLPAAVVLGFATHLLVVNVVYAQGRAAWDAGEDQDAIDVFDRQRSVVPVEQWKADFNAGTAYLRAERTARALDALDQALVGVPDAHRCAVQTNRALALEGEQANLVEMAQRSLDEAEEILAAQVARDAGEPYDEELVEPPYDDADPYVEELRWAQYLLDSAADQAALRIEALADPACTPPPSAGGGGGGGEDEQDEQDARDEARGQAQQQVRELGELAQDVGETATAAEQGGSAPSPAPGSGTDPAPAPAPQDAEAQRQAELAERNEQANGGGAGADPGAGDAPGGGSTGGGTQPGQGGTAPGGRRW